MQHLHQRAEPTQRRGSPRTSGVPHQPVGTPNRRIARECPSTRGREAEVLKVTVQSRVKYEATCAARAPVVGSTQVGIGVGLETEGASNTSIFRCSRLLQAPRPVIQASGRTGVSTRKSPNQKELNALALELRLIFWGGEARLLKSPLGNHLTVGKEHPTPKNIEWLCLPS